MKNFQLDLNQANYTALVANSQLLNAVNVAANKINDLYQADEKGFIIEPVLTNARNIIFDTNFNFQMFVGSLSNYYSNYNTFDVLTFINDYNSLEAYSAFAYFPQIDVCSVLRYNNMNYPTSFNICTRLTANGVILKANLNIIIPY